MAQIQEKAAFNTFGLNVSDSSSSSGDSEVDSEFADDSDVVSPCQAAQQEATLPELVSAIRSSAFNWFDLYRNEV